MRRSASSLLRVVRQAVLHSGRVASQWDLKRLALGLRRQFATRLSAPNAYRNNPWGIVPPAIQEAAPVLRARNNFAWHPASSRPHPRYGGRAVRRRLVEHLTGARWRSGHYFDREFLPRSPSS